MSYTIRYHPQVDAALSSLDAVERGRVLARIRRLAESGLSDSHISRLNGVSDREPEYVLRTGNNLRVVFTANHDSIMVLDVLNGYLAERYG